MTRTRRNTRFLLSLSVATLALAGAWRARAGFADDAPAPGAVYTMTNAATNQIMAFTRATTGALTPLGTYNTNGSGNAMTLADQGAVILNASHRFLFAVNSASNTISSFAVQPDGSLAFVSQVSSGGTLPVSLTIHGTYLYVANRNTRATPTITGFTVSAPGVVAPLPGSTVNLSASNANPGQVGFSNNGSLLVVTEKTTSNIDTFTVSNGIASAPLVQNSNGQTPFGFAIDNLGHLIVSELTASAMSSYDVAANGVLTVVSGSIPDGGKDACWAVTTNNRMFPNQYAYTTNTGSHTISSYTIAANGALTLLASTNSPSDSLDMALGPNSQYLYVVGGKSGMIQGYSVASTGALTKLNNFVSVPTTSLGLAAY